MLPGPVFNLELLTTARRARYYAVRLIYGLILLFVLFQNYYWAAAMEGSAVSARRMSELAYYVFATIAAVQVAVVMVLTPTLLAGVIADERQRKTLHYLLASRLTSGEIVLGKLCARMLHVGVFMAIGLPVINLLSLFGGVDPLLVLAVYGGTLSLAFFLGSIALVVSTTSKRVREAIAACYSIELAWLIIPPMISTLMPSQWPRTYAVIGPINDWVAATNPFNLVLGIRGGGNAVITASLWMVGLQVLAGTFLVAVAVWRLRPFFRNQESRGDTRLFGKRKRVGKWYFRLFPRPPVGDDGMIWKERFSSRTTGVAKVILTVLAVGLFGVLLYWTVSFAIPAAIEAWRFGYAPTSGPYSSRDEFTMFLRVCCTILCTLAALGATTAGGNAFTSEKEEDTWTSLVATPLDPWEIVRAKLFGSVWKASPFLLVAAALASVGLVCGSVHPVAYLTLVVEAVTFVGFGAALGCYLSLRSKTTWRAQTTAVAIWMVANGGYSACICPFLRSAPRVSVLFFAGCTPMIEAISIHSVQEFTNLWSGSLSSQLFPIEGAAAVVLAVFAYGAAGCILALRCLHRFDEAADRPRLPDMSFLHWDDKPKPVKPDVGDRGIVFE
jgi:ABC-type transport system involved in multi-copper enzyme maturation permease subunit